MISDGTHPNRLALGGPCSWNIKRHNPGSDMKEATPKWPFLSTFHLRRHYSHQKQQNTTLFKGWRQEPSPGEEHSSCRNTVAMTGAKCRPPRGSHCAETSADRDLIPKVPQRLCRCPDQRHSAKRNGRGMSTLVGEEQEGPEAKWDKGRMGQSASKKKDRSLSTHPSHNSQRRACTNQ